MATVNISYLLVNQFIDHKKTELKLHYRFRSFSIFAILSWSSVLKYVKHHGKIVLFVRNLIVCRSVSAVFI